jgi:hypothetical protein
MINSYDVRKATKLLVLGCTGYVGLYKRVINVSRPNVGLM